MGLGFHSKAARPELCLEGKDELTPYGCGLAGNSHPQILEEEKHDTCQTAILKQKIPVLCNTTVKRMTITLGFSLLTVVR